MKILITGAHGFVGTRLMKELEGAIAAPSIQGMNEKQIRQIVEESEADIFVYRKNTLHPYSCNFGCGDL